MTRRSDNFVIGARIWGTKVLPLEAAKYPLLTLAYQCLMTCLALEEAYEIVLLNYISFEKAMLGAIVEHMVERPLSRPAYDSIRREIDRHLVNLLASGEMYSDHVEASVTRLERALGRQNVPCRVSPLAVGAAAGRQRDRLLGARAVEKLRDHVLHLSLPVSSWTQSDTWIDTETDELGAKARLRHTFSVAFDPTLLLRDSKMDRDLVDQLVARADDKGRVAWSRIIREYVEALSYFQKDVRDLLNSSEAWALTLTADEVDNYRTASGMQPDQKGAIAVAALATDGSWEGVVPLDFDYGERVNALREKNRRTLTNLHRREMVG